MPRTTVDPVSKQYRVFNDWVRSELVRRKKKQEELAFYLNLSRKSLVLRLSGKVEWSFREVLQVLEFLETSIGEVV